MNTGDEKAEKLIESLRNENWTVALKAVAEVGSWLGSSEASSGGPLREDAASALLWLSGHAKWEVRRAVANVTLTCRHQKLDAALRELVLDPNVQVRRAAERAQRRRADWSATSSFGEQHRDLLNAVLDDVEVRFGPKARLAAKRAGEQLANTFGRELYHETINLIAPITAAAERMESLLRGRGDLDENVEEELVRIKRRTAHLQNVMGAMRQYVAQPKFKFVRTSVCDVVRSATNAVKEAMRLASRGAPPVSVVLNLGDCHAEIEPTRLHQATANIVSNAVDACSRGGSVNVITRLDDDERVVIITVSDSGTGMSEASLAEAATLFSTSKKGGTGFGLPLAMKVIEDEHAGTLTIRSERSVGTTVTIAIPVERAQ